MDVPVAANVLGTMGAACWSIQVGHLSIYIIAQRRMLIDYSLYPKLSSTIAVIMQLGSNQL
jgi:hypothetical protein